MEKISYYSQKDCDVITERIKKGYGYVKDLRTKIADEDAFFVFLVSDDREINQWTLYYIPILRKARGVSNFIIITRCRELFENGTYDCRFPYQIMECDALDIEAVCTYLYCITSLTYRQEVLRLLINGAAHIQSERLLGYMEFEGITKKEIVALVIYRFQHVPDIHEVEIACRYDLSPSNQKINWGEHRCYETMELLLFPEVVNQGINNIIHEGKIYPGDKIVIFSDTKTTRHIIDILQGYDILAVLDNDKEKEGSCCGGVRVYNPEIYLAGAHRDDIKIIVPTKSYKAICEQLHGLGYIIDKQVFVSYVEYEHYNGQQMSEEYLEGREIYQKIREIYPKERLYYITFNGIGDTYLAGLYLRDRMEYDRVSRGVVLFVSDTCRRTFSILDHGANVTGEYVVGDLDAALKLLLFIKQTGYDKLNACNVTHSFDFIDPGYLRGYKGLDFNTMVQIGSYHAPTKKTEVKVFSDDSSDILLKNNLTEGKTVILSPYAKSSKELSPDFWIELSEKLIAAGYIVCTNVAGSEQAIEGTIPLSTPLEQIFDLVERCGIFIGLRSGLCDLISRARAKKIILYSLGQSWGGDYTYSFFGLKNMGFADENTWEYIVEADYHMTINEIITCLT